MNRALVSIAVCGLFFLYSVSGTPLSSTTLPGMPIPDGILSSLRGADQNVTTSGDPLTCTENQANVDDAIIDVQCASVSLGWDCVSCQNSSGAHFFAFTTGTAGKKITAGDCGNKTLGICDVVPGEDEKFFCNGPQEGNCNSSVVLVNQTGGGS